MHRVTGMMNDLASSSMIIGPRQSDVSRQVELCPFLAVKSWLVRNNEHAKMRIITNIHMSTVAVRGYNSENIFNFSFKMCVKLFIRKDLYGKI